MTRVGGIIKFLIDGVQLPAKGNFTFGLGTPKRETVIGTDGVHGYKETPTAPYIEGAITDSLGTDLKALFNLTNVTVLLDLANGKSVVLHDAYYCGDGETSTEEGEVKVRFEGSSAEEFK